MSDKVIVLITAVGGGGHGEQILKALKLAEGTRYHIIGADAQLNCPQFELVDESVQLPLASEPAYLETLLNVCERFGVNALFHGCEPELKVMSAARDLFAQRNIFLPINPAPLIDLCMSKEATNRRLLELGFTAPRFQRVTSREQLNEVDWFPVVVKPSTGGGGSANVFIAQNPSELNALADYLGMENIRGTFLVQEYVGRPDEEFTVGVLHDLDGVYLNSIAVHRLLGGQLNIRTSVANRTDRTELGQKLVISSGVSQGWVGRFPTVTEQCKEIAEALGAKGSINIQCRLVDGVVRVFEINPRFSGTTSIRAMMGYNEPDLLIRRHLLGETIVPHFEYEEGLVLRGLIEYHVPESKQAITA